MSSSSISRKTNKNSTLNVCIITTSKCPSIAGSSTQSAEAVQILDPQTGSLLSAHGGAATLKIGQGVAIKSFQKIPIHHHRTNHYSTGGCGSNENVYIAYGGKGSDDMHAYLIVQGSTTSPKWKCRVPEYLEGGIFVSPCGNFILGGGKSGNCYCWSTLNDGELLRSWAAHYRSILSITFSDCGSYVITGGADGIVNVWNLMDVVSTQDYLSSKYHGRKSQMNNKTIHPIKTWSEHHLPVTSMHTLPSSRIVSTSLDKQVIIMELFSGKTLAKIAMPFAINVVTADKVGNRLYLGAKDGAIYCIDMNTYAIATTAESASIITNKYSTKEKQSRSLSGTLLEETILRQQKDLQGNGHHNTTDTPSYVSELRGHNREISSLAFLQEDEYDLLVSGSVDGSVRIWDLKSRCCIRSLNPWSTTNILGQEENVTSGKVNPCSSITVIPRECIENPDSTFGHDGMFTSNVSNNHKANKQGGTLSSLIKPLQRFSKRDQLDHNDMNVAPNKVETVTNITQSVRNRVHFDWIQESNSYRFDDSTPDNKRARISDNDSTPVNKRARISDNSGNVMEDTSEMNDEDLPCNQEEITDMQNEIARLKEEVTRWQNVNNKLISKIEKISS